MKGKILFDGRYAICREDLGKSFRKERGRLKESKFLDFVLKF